MQVYMYACSGAPKYVCMHVFPATAYLYRAFEELV